MGLPIPFWYVALDKNGKIHNKFLYLGHGNGIDADLLDGKHASEIGGGITRPITPPLLTNEIDDLQITLAKLELNLQNQMHDRLHLLNSPSDHDFTGSDLADLETRDYYDLQNLPAIDRIYNEYSNVLSGSPQVTWTLPNFDSTRPITTFHINFEISSNYANQKAQIFMVLDGNVVYTREISTSPNISTSGTCVLCHLLYYTPNLSVGNHTLYVECWTAIRTLYIGRRNYLIKMEDV